MTHMTETATEPDIDTHLHQPDPPLHLESSSKVSLMSSKKGAMSDRTDLEGGGKKGSRKGTSRKSTGKSHHTKSASSKSGTKTPGTEKGDHHKGEEKETEEASSEMVSYS